MNSKEQVTKWLLDNCKQVVDSTAFSWYDSEPKFEINEDLSVDFLATVKIHGQLKVQINSATKIYLNDPQDSTLYFPRTAEKLQFGVSKSCTWIRTDLDFDSVEIFSQTEDTYEVLLSTRSKEEFLNFASEFNKANSLRHLAKIIW